MQRGNRPHLGHPHPDLSFDIRVDVSAGMDVGTGCYHILGDEHFCQLENLFAVLASFLRGGIVRIGGSFC